MLIRSTALARDHNADGIDLPVGTPHQEYMSHAGVTVGSNGMTASSAQTEGPAARHQPTGGCADLAGTKQATFYLMPTASKAFAIACRRAVHFAGSAA